MILTIASRWVDSHKFRVYARLVRAMTRYEALSIFGLPASATPDQIKSKYRELALQNHPDRGGDLRKMQQINVARDVLLSSGASAPPFRPDRSSPPPRRPYPGGGSSVDQEFERLVEFVKFKKEAHRRYLEMSTGQPWQATLRTTGNGFVLTQGSGDYPRIAVFALSKAMVGAWGVTIIYQRVAGSRELITRHTANTVEEMEAKIHDTVEFFKDTLAEHKKGAKIKPLHFPGSSLKLTGGSFEIVGQTPLAAKMLHPEVHVAVWGVVLIGKRPSGFQVAVVTLRLEGVQDLLDGTPVTWDDDYASLTATVANPKEIPRAILTLCERMGVVAPKKFSLESIQASEEAIKRAIRSRARGTLALKDAMAGAGYIESSGSGRKITVEMSSVLEPSVSSYLKTVSYLYFNGKQFRISEAGRANIASKNYMRAILEKTLNKKLNLTRVRSQGWNPVKLLSKLLELLPNESSELTVNLLQAIEAAEDAEAAVNRKTASAEAVLTVFTGSEAEVFTGTPVTSILETAYGNPLNSYGSGLRFIVDPTHEDSSSRAHF